MMTCYHADWLFTGEGQPIPDGLLIVDEGRICYAGPRRSDSVDIDLNKSLVIPGLVNAHTHLDLGECRDLGVRGQGSGNKRSREVVPFTDWLREVVNYRRTSTVRGRERAIEEGIQESLAAGTTLLADISVDGESFKPLHQAMLRSVVFLELLGLSVQGAKKARRAALDWVRWKYFQNGMVLDSNKLRLGLSPHAPYSIHTWAMHRIVGTANVMRLACAMHFAETLEEIELIKRQTGPFREFLQDLGVWHPENLVQTLDQAISCIAKSPFPLLIHGNYLSNEEIDRIPWHVSVVYCPRTHAYFGHKSHPYQTMLKRQINVALGTDSLASNPDLSILHEARFLWQRDKQHLRPETLLKMVTINGAKALGFGDVVGTLSEGKYADFVVLPCPAYQTNPWEQLWESATEPVDVFIAGESQRKII